MACEDASVAIETSPGEDAHHTMQMLPCKTPCKSFHAIMSENKGQQRPVTPSWLLTVCIAVIRCFQLECMVLVTAYSSLIPC